MAATRYRHCGGIELTKPQELRGGNAAPKYGETVPWSAEYSRRVFDGEWADVLGESIAVSAAIDDSDGSVVGFVQVVPQNRYVGVVWLPEPPEIMQEIDLGFYQIDETPDHPEKFRTHKGYEQGELEANEGRLRLTNVQYRLLRDDNSGIAENWIFAGDCTARRQTIVWDSDRNMLSDELTDYEDVYGLSSDDLWFDYPEFDRYDHLIFRDAPVLEKLGVPDEIRLKPVPAMPLEVDG